MALYMRYYRFKAWCDQAVSGIVFPPDRKKVSAELYLHMEDHYDDLIEQGIPPETAEQQVVSAMGSAKELAPLLAAVHRPFWGYFLRFTRILLAVSLCLTLIFMGNYLRNRPYYKPSGEIQGVYDTETYGQAQGLTLGSYSEPGRSFHVDGYTFTVTKAVLWISSSQENRVGDLTIQLNQFNPIPWADSAKIFECLWAEDSFGNHYCGINSVSDTKQDDLTLSGYARHTAPLTYTHEISLYGAQLAEAEWVDLHYSREGREFVFRIDLTGGDAS